MPVRPRNRRIFFALWPDERVRQALAEVQGSLPLTGQLVKPANLHLTLAFVGTVEEDHMQSMAQAVSAVSARAFSATFDCIGYFKKPQIAWLGPGSSPEALFALVRSLSEAIAPFGYEAGSQHFRPHITLARKSRPLFTNGGQQKISPVSWQVSQFALVESRLTKGGADYSVLRTYDLV